MGLITGYSIYDNNGNILFTQGLLPKNISAINARLVHGSQIKVLCNDDSFILAFLIVPSRRYVTSVTDDESFIRATKMMKEMATSIGHTVSDNAPLLTLRESDIMQNYVHEEMESLISDPVNNSNGRSKKICAYVSYGLLTGMILLIAIGAIVYIIVSEVLSNIT